VARISHCKRCGLQLPPDLSKFAQPFCDDACRFWHKVKKTDGCWVWTAASAAPGGRGDNENRGRFYYLGRLSVAPKVSWELSHGPIPKGLFVCHHCDNPICVRPEHLFLGTAADNMADMSAKGRHVAGRMPGALNHKAKLREDQVIAIRNDSRRLSVVAADYGVSKNQIWLIRKGYAWKHLA
jgi:hypothetical protein